MDNDMQGWAHEQELEHRRFEESQLLNEENEDATTL
jgi:hypothetical protein